MADPLVRFILVNLDRPRGILDLLLIGQKFYPRSNRAELLARLKLVE